MFKKLLLTGAVVLAALIAVLTIAVAMQPTEFRVVRETVINAPPEVVFAHVNDFHQWQAWSPWAKLDPNAENSFEGPSAGKGAVFRWSGNDDVGEGSMTILESRPAELVKIRLHFVRPYEDTATAEFTFEPQNEQTAVAWSMYGENNFIAKAMCLFMEMDQMIGGDFEKGLAGLKTIAESEHSGDSNPSAEVQSDQPSTKD